MPDFSRAVEVTPAAVAAEAERRTGLTASGGTYQPGLELVCAGLTSARLTPGGRALLAGEAVDYLANRLRVDDEHRRRPELAASPVVSPVVILGLPRTGTTVLSYLLDRDPQWRSLLNWEAIQSVPPPTTHTLRSDQRCLDRLAFQEAVFPTLDPPPPHWEWADGPTECTFLLAQDFRTVMWETRVPNPDYREFLSTCDMGPAYQHHRRTLQVLQSQAPGRWVLKMPAHAYFIDTLLDTYPDARIIWAHRDPYRAAASFMDLVSFAHGLALREVDTVWIAHSTPPRLAEYVRRAEEALGGRDVHHVHYTAMAADPLGEMARLYRWLDLELGDEVRRSMQQWITDDPIRKPRKRPYGLADFGLVRTDLEPAFADYVARYDITLEPGAD
ncbi:MAG: sulfotransferase [Acidimicrobiia bacterium]|nr:sulfotransferase [Acidimicrobiia bacterium]